ncbi:MAG: flagellar hook-associated protein FlgK [Rhizobiaceae bacterium]|nr:flagellar hook-associated protein FlgK [Rhizobiaceae bacterium]
MTLSSALHATRSIFNNSGTQSSVISNNIANQGNENYVRREAKITVSSEGAQVVQIARASEPSLQRYLLASTSKDAAQQTLVKGLEGLKTTIGGNDYDSSPATYLSALHSAMQTYAALPGSTTGAQAAVAAAQDVANSLNNATKAIQAIRASADKEIASDVDKLNGLLAQFETANNAVKSSKATGTDPNDALDQRDALLKQISQIVGIRTVTRDNNDMALYTSDGTTLFETIPRSVTFKPTGSYTAETTGNSVYIDGVPLQAGDGATTTGQGTLQARLQVRDGVVPTYQKQLDELARGLVEAFAETSSVDGSKAAGLFTWSDGTVPDDASVVPGIAGTIKVNEALITSLGGNPHLLRDGGINGDDYVANTSGGTGYSGNIDKYLLELTTSRDFDPSSAVDSKSSILQFASNSIGWLEGERSRATTAAESTAAHFSASFAAYSNETGVNMDEELMAMMAVEQSYKAGTKLLNAINDMLDQLLRMT